MIASHHDLSFLRFADGLGNQAGKPEGRRITLFPEGGSLISIFNHASSSLAVKEEDLKGIVAATWFGVTVETTAQKTLAPVWRSTAA